MSSLHPITAITHVNADRECLTTLSKTAGELLKFRLYKDTEGIWARCDWCNTWRYVAEQKDPAPMLTRKFRCRDVEKRCEIDDDEGVNEVFYEIAFGAGSLVWAKRPDARGEKDWLWWPALVEDSPDSVSQYFVLGNSSNSPIAYHVTYLDAYRTGGWVRSDLIKPFNSETKSLNKASLSRAGKRKRLLEEAVERAKKAAKLDIVQRLENFSYIAHLARLTGFIERSESAERILNGTDDPSINSARDESNKEISEEISIRARKRKSDTLRSEVPSRRKSFMRKLGTENAQSTVRESVPGLREKNDDADVSVLKKEETGAAGNSARGIDAKLLGGRSPIEDPKRSKKKRDFQSTRVAEPGKGERNLRGDSVQDGREPLGIRSEPAAQKKRASVSSAKNEKSPSLENGTAVLDAAQACYGVPQVSQREAVGITKVSKRNAFARQKKARERKKKNDRDDSGTEILSENTPNEDIHGIPNSASDPKSQETIKHMHDSGVLDDPQPMMESPSALYGADSMQSVDSLTPTVESPSFSNEADSMQDKSKPKNSALPPSKSLRENKPKKRDMRHEGDKPEFPASSFTQPRRIVTKPIGRKEPAKLYETGTVKAAHGSSLSQPLPPRARGKFAPPTRAKPLKDGYTLEDFQTDLSTGVI